MNKQQNIEQLFNTMGQLRKLLESEAQESHEEKAATIMQYSALKYLSTNGNCTVGTLAAYLRLSKSSATQLIERLEKSGFAERVDDKNDRRVVHVVVTKSGKEQLSELKRKFMDRVSRLFSKIPAQDLQELIRIHTELIETLKKEKTK